MDLNVKWSSLCSIKNLNNLKIKDYLNNNIEIIDNNNNKEYDMEDIVSNFKEVEKLQKLNSIELLKEEYELSLKIHKFYFQVNKNTKIIILKCINYLLNITNILSNRIQMNKIDLNNKLINFNNIPRSSYKFCSFKEACKFNYNQCSNKGCFAHHFVHNMLEYDINNLKYFIETFLDDEKILNNNIIIKSLTTINFVIKHMYDELNNILIYSKDKNKEK